MTRKARKIMTGRAIGCEYHSRIKRASKRMASKAARRILKAGTRRAAAEA